MKSETIPLQLLIHLAQQHQNGFELAGGELPVHPMIRRNRFDALLSSNTYRYSTHIVHAVALGLVPTAISRNSKSKPKLIVAGLGVSTAATLLFHGTGYWLKQSQLKKDKKRCYKQFQQQFESVETLLKNGLECDPVLVREVMLYRRDLIQVIDLLSRDPVLSEETSLYFKTAYSAQSLDAIYSVLCQSISLINTNLAEQYFINKKCSLRNVNGMKAILVVKDQESYDTLNSLYQSVLSTVCENVGLELKLVLSS